MPHHEPSQTPKLVSLVFLLVVRELTSILESALRIGGGGEGAAANEARFLADVLAGGFRGGWLRVLGRVTRV